MHSDAVFKVEKLNAVQQLTATITPPSTVNMMSNDENCCFHCQEHGHTARNSPTLGVWSVTIMSHYNGLSTQDTSFGDPSKTSPIQTA